MRDKREAGIAIMMTAGYCCQVETHSNFHRGWLRLDQQIGDTTNMMQSIRQPVCIVFFVVFLFALSSQAQSSKRSDLLNYLSNQSSFLHYARFQGQAAPTKEIRSLLDRQARWDDAGRGDSNGSGQRLRFEKIDDQVKPGDKGAARYRVYAEGAPQDKVFVFQTWLVDGTLRSDPRDIYVNAQGLLMIHKPKAEQESSLRAGDDELVVESATENAEPIRFLLARRDGETPIYGTLVSHPVESYDQGCKLEVRIAESGAAAVLMIVEGFPAKAKIPLVLESEGSVISEVLDTNLDGHAVMAVFPPVQGKPQGTIKASAEGPNCLPSVTLPWSAAATAAPKAPKH